MKLLDHYVVNVVAQGFGRVFTFGSNFIAFALIARICGTDFFGQYSYILSFFAIFVAIADFGMTSVLGKDIAQIRSSPRLYWGNFLLLRVCLNILVIISSIITAYYIRNDLFLILLIGSLALPFLASRFFEPVFQVFQHPWYSAYASIFYGVCHLVLLAIAFLFKDKLSLFIFAYISANAAYTLMALYLSQKSIKPLFHFNKPIVKNILKLALPLGFSSLFVMIGGRIGILMLAGMQSDYAVGIYSAAYKFLELLTFVAAMVTAPLIPIFAEKAKQSIKSLRDISSDFVEILAVLVLPVGIICFSISKEIILFVYGNSLLPAADVFNILIWVSVIIFYSLFISSIVVSIGVTNFAYWLGASAAVLSIVLNYVLIPKYSYIGSAWTALLCEVFLAGTVIFYAVHHIGNIFRWKTWVKILGLNLIMFAFLHEKFFDINIFLKIVIYLIIYIFLIIKLNVVKKDMLDVLSNQKIFSFNSTTKNLY